MVSVDLQSSLNKKSIYLIYNSSSRPSIDLSIDHSPHHDLTDCQYPTISYIAIKPTHSISPATYLAIASPFAFNFAQKITTRNEFYDLFYTYLHLHKPKDLEFNLNKARILGLLYFADKVSNRSNNCRPSSNSGK